MPPAATGVADYSAALVPYLREHGRQYAGDVVLNAPGDIDLYHLGNNGLHREIYQRALEHPGVIVIHDAVLQHFFLGSLDEPVYVDEFVYNYGEWSRELARDLWRERARSGADARYFAYPMLKHIATTALGVIVHNPAAADIVREHAPEATITEVPHLFTPPTLPDSVDTLRLRQSLVFTPGTLVVGAFGHQRETKRVGPLLRAFQRAVESAPNVRLIFSGQFGSEPFERSVEPLLQHPNILRVPYLSERDFWRYAAAIDVCVNLRYPSAAETSGVAIRMMGLGKPVIFTHDRAISRYPDTACLRVDVGITEEDMLVDYLVWLAQDRAAVAEIGRNAAAYIAREHAPAKAAGRYWDAIRTAWEASSRFRSTPESSVAPTGRS